MNIFNATDLCELLKMVKIVIFMLCIFYYNKKKRVRGTY